MSSPTVSVVIPTRNRQDSLERLLGALNAQTRTPDEVLIADASEDGGNVESLTRAGPDLTIRHFTTSPSVTAQRNEAIRRATGSHVWLCDDDLVPPPEYLERLLDHLRGQSPMAVTGMVYEANKGGLFQNGFPVHGLRYYLLGFFSQRTVWGDLRQSRQSGVTGVLLAPLARWFAHRGNTWSLAGWPLVTQIEDGFARTAVYHLGAALVPRDWLIASPYDERLDPHGMGDHYGVAIGFPEEQAVTVLTDLQILHQKVPANRIERVEAHRRRILALHYFMRRSSKFSRMNEAFLIWSLAVGAAGELVRGDWRALAATAGAATAILTGRNPLLSAARPS